MFGYYVDCKLLNACNRMHVFRKFKLIAQGALIAQETPITQGWPSRTRSDHSRSDPNVQATRTSGPAAQADLIAQST